MDNNNELRNKDLSEYELSDGACEYVNGDTMQKDISKQIKAAKKKGRIQGALIVLGTILIIGGIVIAINVTRMISNGTIYAKLVSFGNKSVLDRDTVNKIDEIYRIIDNTFIEEVDKDAIREGIYKGMLEALDDPYSVYYTQEEYKEMMESSSGMFEGIGAYLSQDPNTNQVTVVRPIKGSPAEDAGILSDDIIIEVDGENVEDFDLNLVVSKIRGPKDSQVKLGIKREGETELLYFDVKRDTINVESVSHEMLDDKIGYIIITEFADATGKQFAEAYDELIDNGMEKLIIDLRSNGGGYVDTSVEVANKLIEKGTVVSIKDRHGKGETYKDKGDGNFITIPCVFLVDGNTASASEILTGAIKDYGLATVIGTQTFGKGIVQDILPLKDGSGLKVTNSKYYTPNGENIHKIGIEPDIIVEWDGDRYRAEGIDNQLEAAKSYLKDGKVDSKYFKQETQEDK